MKKLLIVCLILFSFSTVFAEISIKGDARIRPRLDQKFDEDGKTYEDFYYMYWARLWLHAILTDGYYFTTKLGSNGSGTFIGRLADTPYDGDGGYTDASSAISGGRGSLRFLELHFGRNTDKYGYSMGILPMSGIANPELDLHFYPVSKSDVPFHIVNISSLTGFRGYYKMGNNKLNVTLSLDENTGNREDDMPHDQYSLMANYEMKFGEMMIAPTLIYTMADEDLSAPMTIGANAKLPKIAGASLSAGAYYSNQSVDDDNVLGKYSGMMLHVKGSKKIGPGAFTSWVNYRTVDIDANDDKTNTTELWFMYKYVLYKSDVGNFSLAPTYRRIMQNTGDVEYSRNKFEVTLHIVFK